MFELLSMRIIKFYLYYMHKIEILQVQCTQIRTASSFPSRLQTSSGLFRRIIPTSFGISVGPVSSGEGQPGEEEEVQQQDKEAEKRRAWFAVFHRCEMLSLGEQAEEGVTDQRPQGVAE